MENTITYFEKPGADNTEPTLLIAKKRAQELGIKTILIASTRGDGAVKAAELLPGFRLVAVSWSTGFHEPNRQEFTEANRKLFESKGGTVVTGTHLFAGLSRAVLRQFNTLQLGELVASTLRILGQGIKVACEITVMAADAGAVRAGEDVIAIAGSREGADTAVVITPVNSGDFFKLRVREILCKPRL